MAKDNRVRENITIRKRRNTQQIRRGRTITNVRALEILDFKLAQFLHIHKQHMGVNKLQRHRSVLVRHYHIALFCAHSK